MTTCPDDIQAAPRTGAIWDGMPFNDLGMIANDISQEARSC